MDLLRCDIDVRSDLNQSFVLHAIDVVAKIYRHFSSKSTLLRPSNLFIPHIMVEKKIVFVLI